MHLARTGPARNRAEYAPWKHDSRLAGRRNAVHATVASPNRSPSRPLCESCWASGATNGLSWLPARVSGSTSVRPPARRPSEPRHTSSAKAGTLPASGESMAADRPPMLAMPSAELRIFVGNSSAG
eukprot:2227801-Prymnesium_polylepis.1